ncbi:MAG: hypothetical protein M5U31_16305 [Acidimicrobiia bacterium]|nr:hypothetical protein [Acidimicrobiia bacterium]
MSDETNGDGMKHERPEVVDDMAVGVSFFIPEEDQQAVAPARPIMSASGDEIARNVRWFLQRAVDELEHQKPIRAPCWHVNTSHRSSRARCRGSWRVSIIPTLQGSCAPIVWSYTSSSTPSRGIALCAARLTGRWTRRLRNLSL